MTKDFKLNTYVVYPTHGVGKIISIESTKIAGIEIKCFVINFEREKLTLHVPITQIESVGLRPLSSQELMEEVLGILGSGVKKLKGMWSRRVQEYENKINSGNIKLLAEVLRDLIRDIEDAERSYSERVIYETALYRLSSEYATIQNIEIEQAQEKILSVAKNRTGYYGKDYYDEEFDNEFEDEEEDEDEEYNNEGKESKLSSRKITIKIK